MIKVSLINFILCASVCAPESPVTTQQICARVEELSVQTFPSAHGDENA